MNHPKFMGVYELLGLVYRSYAETQGDLDSTEKRYKRVFGIREKRVDKDHPKVVEILHVLRALSQKRAWHGCEVKSESIADMDQFAKGHSDERIPP